MNEYGRWVRRSGSAAVLLAASGISGCGAEDARQDAPADDGFRHAHVLGSAGSVPAKAWSPQEYRRAYNVPDATQDRYRTSSTIIIVAYHNPNLQSDTNRFCAQWNLPQTSLRIINQAGNSTNLEWALEETVDVAMVLTANQRTQITVIEAKSERQADIQTAITTAVNLAHIPSVISMSFGADETGSEALWSSFSSIAGLTWVAASGDSKRPSFPATHPGVIAVGGTTLSSVAPFAETTWVNAGAGMAIVAEMPNFQKIPSVQKLNTTLRRSIPDVAFNANPAFGAQVYSTMYGGSVVVGGTSIAAPFFAGVVSLANASRTSKKKPPLSSIRSGSVSLQDSLYALTSTSGGPTHSTILNDVVSGSAGEGYAAGPGYDVASGLGSVNVQQLIDYLDTR